MRLLIVRHGDPDYERDSLTKKGWREAELLAKRLSKLTVKDFYVSPLGRARDTASLTLKKMNRTAEECQWLREFDVRITRPDRPDAESIAWDWLPQDWTKEERFWQRELWAANEVMHEGTTQGTHDGNGIRIARSAEGGAGAEYDWVVQNLDALLAEHGYVRDGANYRVERANRDTLVFFCHFGLECVLRGADFCDDRLYGRAQKGNRIFPHLWLRGHLASVCRRRGTCVFGAVLRDV